MEGKDGRTEKATPKRRNEQREKGNVCKSQEVISMGVLLFGLMALRFMVPFCYDKLGKFFQEMTRASVGGRWSASLMQGWFFGGASFVGMLIAPIFLTSILGAVIGNMGQVGPYLSMKAMKMSWGGLNPIKGVKKLFSMSSIVNVLMSMLKIVLIAWVIYLVIRTRITEVGSLPFVTIGAMTVWIFSTIYRIALTVVLLFVLIAALDWCYQKYKHEKQMMMTKEEVKEERKSYEPSPLMKKAQRKKMAELTMLRMMAAVPNADVVVTNPTHFAVALKYDPDTMAAPVVVAKGKRLVAQRIKALAREHGIPVLERPPLARALYKYVKVDRPIPSQFFQAVAEILAYLYRLKQGGLRRRKGGLV